MVDEAEELATDEHGKRQKKMHLPRTNTEKHGIRQKQKHGKEEEEKTFLKRNFTETKHCIRFELMNDFKAHGLRSMGLLVLSAAGFKMTHPAQWVGLEDYL